MTSLGTVVPNAASVDCTARYASRVAREKARIADRELAGCDRRVVGGEVRYYDTTDQYAVIGRSGRPLWFAVTPGGDFRI